MSLCHIDIVDWLFYHTYMKDPSKEFMMPFISALTALLWTEAALEALTRGAMRMHLPHLRTFT